MSVYNYVCKLENLLEWMPWDLMVSDIFGMNARNASTPAPAYLSVDVHFLAAPCCRSLWKGQETSDNSTEEFTDIISPRNPLISCLEVEAQ